MSPAASGIIICDLVNMAIFDVENVCEQCLEQEKHAKKQKI